MDVKSNFGQELLSSIHTTYSRQKSLATKPEHGQFNVIIVWYSARKAYTSISSLFARYDFTLLSHLTHCCLGTSESQRVRPRSPRFRLCLLVLYPYHLLSTSISCLISSSATHLSVQSRSGDIFYAHNRDMCNIEWLLLRPTRITISIRWLALQPGRLTHSVLSSSDVKGKALWQAL